jgi:3-carboxy-cis,cis-muconate cycloisomerase
MAEPNEPPFSLLTALFQDQPMAAIWSERATIGAWLRTEAELARAQGEVGLITAADADMIAAACSLDTIDRARLWDDARNVGYPILPLVRQIAEGLSDGPNGRVHYGATTQDIMDTAMAMQLGDACVRVEELLIRLGDGLQMLTEKHASTVMAGRTHAQHAVPTTFGAKMAVFLEEVRRELERVRSTHADVRVVSLFGAGGTSAAMGEKSAQVRSALARRLELADTNLPWHVARGRVAHFGLNMATIAALCTRFAREVVDLSRTEIAEVREQAGHLRGASSTMPQKANPIFSESIIGLAVCAATSATALLRAMEVGHERSAGEWQIEWLTLPAVSVMTATAVALAAESAESLQIFPDVMRRNLEAESGLIMSEAAMMKLAPLLGRERAHDLVYEAAVRGRTNRDSLTVALRATLPPELMDEFSPVEPSDYTGEAEDICASASRRWADTRTYKDSEKAANS